MTTLQVRPVEGRWFRVNPEAINRELFKEKREDFNQEWTRKLILEAFCEWETNWKKYSRKFETMIPIKTWSWVSSYHELSQYAEEFGYQADWTHQALEWAQRLQNGETWEAICNDMDTAKWHRMVIWKNRRLRMVGGSIECDDDSPSSMIRDEHGNDQYKLKTSVPLIVRPC